MNIPLSKVLETLDKKPLKLSDTENLTLGRALSEMLLEYKPGGKMKMLLLAQKAFEGKSLEVDEADLSLIKSAVKESTYGGNLIGGQVELLLEGVKEEKS